MNADIEYSCAVQELREVLTEAFLVLRQVYQYAPMDANTVEKVTVSMKNSEIILAKTDHMR